MSATEHGNQRDTPINRVTETPGSGDESFEDGILAHLPALHRVAVRLTRRPYDAEDLVQETVARALAYRAQFHPGTNLRSWLLTIERSIFLNSYRSVHHAPQLQSMDNLDENTLYSMSGVSASPSAEHVLLQGRIDDEIVDALRAARALPQGRAAVRCARTELRGDSTADGLRVGHGHEPVVPRACTIAPYVDAAAQPFQRAGHVALPHRPARHGCGLTCLRTHR